MNKPVDHILRPRPQLGAAPSLRAQVLFIVFVLAPVLWFIRPAGELIERLRAEAPLQTSARVKCRQPTEVETLVVFVEADAAGTVEVRCAYTTFLREARQ